MSRKKLSRPIRDAIRDGLVRPGVRILDYGCGRGDDVRILEQLGYDVIGWDPTFAPTPAPTSASVVNFGYVLNVIADASQRDLALRQAYELAQEALIVSAYVHNGEATKLQSPRPHLDGVLTCRGTFQKLFYHKELGDYLRQVLGVEPERADFGVYYVRKQPATTNEAWDAPFGDGKEGLLVEFAASFWRPIGKLLKREFTPRQLEIFEAEFTSYVTLCQEAEALLARLDSQSELQAAYRKAPFGKRTREALYVHRSSVKYLPELMKAIVATAYEVALAQGDCPWELVKIVPTGETVSFLDCEPFDVVDYPALRASVCVKRAHRTSKRRKESSSNPSIYHRKELFVHQGHHCYDSFRQLTLGNESSKLLSRSDIGRKNNWQKIQQQSLKPTIQTRGE